MTSRPDSTNAATAAASIPAGLPLPAAMNRVARARGLGLDASDDALIAEFGDKPTPSSIAMLSEELGGAFRFERAKGAPSQTPAIAILRNGGALVVTAASDQGLTVEGANGAATFGFDELAPQLTGIYLAFGLTDQSPHKLVNQATVAPTAKDGENKPARTGALSWLIAALWRRSRPEFLQLLAASLVINAFMVALPLYIMSVYDRVIPHTAFESLVTLTVGVGIVLIADLGLRFTRLKFSEVIGLKISRDLQMSLYRRLLFVKLARRPNHAAAITNIQNEVEAICLLTPDFLAAAVADTLLAISILTLIAYIGGGIVVAPIIGAALVVMTVFIGSWGARKQTEQAAMLKSAASAQVGETLDSLTGVKANAAEHALMARFENIADAAGLKGHLARQRARFSGHAAGVIVQGTVVATLFLGVTRIDAGLMSIGNLAATTILVGRAVMPVSHLVDQFCRLWTLKDVLNGAFAFVDEEEEKAGERDGGEGRPFAGAVSLRNVSYRHDSSGVMAVSDLSLDIAAGEKIGVVGKNGSGKSTLLHLIPQLYTPSDGAILIDGYDSRQYSARRLRLDIGFMPQETTLFNATIRENICLGVADVDEAAFEQAVRLSGVDRFVRRHPQGYSLTVGPRGEFLSAGERQAVGLARTLLRPRKMLLLDEPSSLMDHTAEAELIAALGPYLQDKTTLISTHRLKLLELVDRVIVLDQGRIAMDGPRDEILARLGGGSRPSSSTALNAGAVA